MITFLDFIEDGLSYRMSALITPETLQSTLPITKKSAATVASMREQVMRILERLTGQRLPPGIVKILQKVEDPLNPLYQTFIAKAIERMDIDRYLAAARLAIASLGGAA